MNEKDLLDKYLLDPSRATIFEPSNTVGNNLQVRAILRGLTGSTDYKSMFSYDTGVDQEIHTKFNDPDLLESLFGVLDSFFIKESKSAPDINGGTDGLTTDVEIITGEIVLRANDNAPISMLPIYASKKTCPTQFFASQDAITLDVDEECSLRAKDMLYVLPLDYGFILSMDMEQYGAMMGCFSDVLNVGKGKRYSEKAQLLMKPTAQEKIYEAFAAFYKYLKSKGELDSTLYKL